MQELRLVAVSEDGSYLVLATAGRGTRFTLPVDDRLRAAVRGHFSRLGQFEIEVESPLRPKEIQARIRAGETAEEIAETAGIPVERVRWFEGPVLQEREYMAQQAQRVVVRRQGEGSPGPPLGEMVGDRLGRRGVDLEEVEWDSWKCEDSTWRVRLSFFHDGRPFAAEWLFDPRRRQVSALDEEAARLSSLDVDNSITDTVTPLAPRRPAMKIVSDASAPAPAPPRTPQPPAREPVYAEPVYAEPAPAAAEPDFAADPSAEPAPEPAAAQAADRPGDDIEGILAATRERSGGSSGRDDRADQGTAAAAPADRGTDRDAPREPARAEPAAPSAPAASAAPAPAPDERGADSTEEREEVHVGKVPAPAEEVAEEVAGHVAAAANGGSVPPPAAQTGAKAPPAQPARNRRKGSNRGKRASVPSWDEIMFGARRPE
jgi:hypothetical protein